MKGTIIKGISGFYYVNTENTIVECKARGKFRRKDLIPLVGDKVEVTVSNNKGVIEKIYDRRNKLIRPAVANVTQAFIIFAVKNPKINVDLLNKFLVLCEYNELKVTVCFNKLDLILENNENEIIKMIEKAGYDTIFLEAINGKGINKIRDKLKDNVTVFCGPSGVGKSTILNEVAGKELMKTGNISKKLLRGKHTTRHSELIEVEGGFIVDTPGFSSLDIDFISKEDLQFCFPEFLDYINTCKFSGCIHYKEPGCSIKEAVENGEICKERYKFYINTIEKIINRRNIRW